MRISKDKLRDLILEELEVVLTNEEAGELFGNSVQDQLTEEEVLHPAVQNIVDLIDKLPEDDHKLLLRMLIKGDQKSDNV